MPNPTTPQAVLETFFGYSTFRDAQLEIISTILAGHDMLAVLPTGGGKSLCFQIPGLLLEGTTIVISPLISLMKDQVDRLNGKGIAATYINSSLTPEELEQRLKLAEQSTYRFIYLSPERLATPKFKQLQQKLQVPLIVIDEAHCISEWGHDFRPEYKQIADRIAELPQRPIVAAFTATATPIVRKEIKDLLQLQAPVTVSQSTVRTNLFLRSYQCVGRTCQELALFRILKKHATESGIIYAATRAQTEELAERIGILMGRECVASYHGGLDAIDRSRIQQRFIENKTRIVVATNAFGMGIDKPDIRYVIHFQLPSSLEQYSQEAGRAGRDQLPASAYLLYNPENLAIHTKLISHNGTQRWLQEQRLLKLSAMSEFCIKERCLHQQIAEYFGEQCDPCFTRCGYCKGENWNHHLAVALENEKERELIQKLLELRQHLAQKHNCSITTIFTDKVLCQLALFQPKTEGEARTLAGIGDGWIQLRWKEIQHLFF